MRLTSRVWLEYTRAVRHLEKVDRHAAAVELLILAHLDMVERMARHLGRQPFLWHVDLEDLIANGRLGLCQAADRYRPGRGEFQPYAYRRIKGAIIDPYRRRGMREDANQSLEELCERLGFIPEAFDTDPHPRPDARADARKIHQQLRVAIEKMNEPERSVLIAHLQGMSQAAIAEQYGRGLTWLRATLATAKRQVSNLMQGRAA